jgi:cytochrome bd-type quinol oxidase subunit 2
MNTQFLAKLGEGTGFENSEGALGKLIGNVFSMAVTVGGLFVFFQMVMGALNWINSQGDKEKITKAQKQITNALIGLVLLVMVWVLFFTITGDILGIFERREDGGGWAIVIPSLFGD